jgi:hypothetical protein
MPLRIDGWRRAAAAAALRDSDQNRTRRDIAPGVGRLNGDSVSSGSAIVVFRSGE